MTLAGWLASTVNSANAVMVKHWWLPHVAPACCVS